jgi:RNA polymerase sigma-70 factor, ECF subfamily
MMAPGLGGNLQHLCDEALVHQAGAGNVAAFEELLGRYEEKLLRLAAHFVDNVDDAQDILQGAFLSIWRHLPAFEGRSQIGTWLHRVVVNASLTFLRARHSSIDQVVGGLGSGIPDDYAQCAHHSSGVNHPQKPDEQIQSEELRRYIGEAIARLPTPLHTVFVVSAVDGLSVAETARVLGISEAAVKTRLHRARLALRQDVGSYLTP